ncbi:prepilin peptidase [Gorillibacterium sp. sgz5001074]|uniref:prepilin peptidase n=1 Tax=Gorillibacterium sp. sgz5001074 TaxID=3446695 RepID=UPI003F67325A
MVDWPVLLTSIPGAVFLFAVGASFGSFFNVAGLRLPAGQSVIRPPSACPCCGHRLSPLDLIPVLGWLLLRGRCRYCGTPVSKVYPAGELATGILFAILPFAIADHREWAVAYSLVSLLAVLTVSDLKYRLLPNLLLYPAILWFGLLRLFVSHPLPASSYLIGFLLGGGMLWVISFVFERMGKHGMGGGDVKLMALLGLVLGTKLVFITIFLSALMGSVVGMALIGAGRLDRKTGMPFGPFIAAGALFALMAGDRLADWYMGLFLY